MSVPREALRSREVTALSSVDSPTVFVAKSLLIPTIPLATLAACLALSHEPLRGGYVLVGVLAFLGAPDVLGIPRIGTNEDRRPAGELLLEITVRWAALITFILLVAYLAGLGRTFDWPLMVAWFAITPPSLLAGQWAARQFLTQALRRKVVHRAVIVGATELGARLETALRADELLRTEIVGYFEDRGPARFNVDIVAPVLGTTAALAAYVAANPVDQIFITLPMSRDARITLLLETLQDSTASIYFVPDLFAFNLIQAHFDVLGGIPVVAVRDTPFYGSDWLFKRLSDVCISAAAIVLLAPVLLAVAVAIRLDSSGPVLFHQKRYGLDGREFLVLKFRSMSVTEDGKNVFVAASRGDPRVTRVGAFIRKTSIDELPQLFNVLVGSMSIVGPRPHAVAMNEYFRRTIPSYMVRHKIKPGITGWAQVNGCRGGDDMEAMRKRIELDLAYIRHWSLGLDLRILFRTVSVLWSDRNAY